MSILVVGDYYNKDDYAADEPFQGSNGHLLEQIMHQAGISRDEYTCTNVFNLYPPTGRLEGLCSDPAIKSYVPVLRGKRVNVEYQPEIDELWEHIERVRPVVIVAMGLVPLWALCNDTGIEAARGRVMRSLKGHKVICTYHPSTIMRMYSHKPIAVMDLHKAYKESKTLSFPDYPSKVYIPETVEDVKDYYLTEIVPAEIITADIETQANTITEIGFAPTKNSAIVIPFYKRDETRTWTSTQRDIWMKERLDEDPEYKHTQNYWSTLAEEIEVWNMIRYIFLEKQIVGQNFAYDMKYLWRMGITVPNFLGDTMLLHHAIQPELKKGLGFLSSLYTNRPAWKHMLKQSKTLKKGD